jgi:acyl-coenzyme A thioesterase 9
MLTRSFSRSVRSVAGATRHFSQAQFSEKTPITISLWDKRKEYREREELIKKSGLPVEAKTSKKPVDSRVDARYDFGCTAGLKELYIDSFGNVLMGKLLEDLDALAGNVAFFHCDDEDPDTSALSLVTAGVEKIKFERRGVPLDNDLIITGQVVYTGSSSLDVLIEAHVAPSTSNHNPHHNTAKVRLLDPAAADTKVLSSVFTYVARNKETGKAAKIIALDMEGEETSDYERAFFTERQAQAVLRKKIRTGEATPEKRLELTDELRWKMLEKGKSMTNMPALHAHNNSVLQQTTALENSFICEPQKSNTGGRVFGGFLINKAYMLAQANAYLFSGMQGTLSLVDKITFRRPVEISDLIRLRSRCTYSSNETPRRMVVQVTCDVVHPEHGTSFQSNNFTFVFTCSDDVERVNRKMIVPLNRLEAEYLYRGAVDVLGLSPETVENEFSSQDRKKRK